MARYRIWLMLGVCGLLWASASAINVVKPLEKETPRVGVSVGFLPSFSSVFGSLGVGLDSNVVNAGIAAIALTAAAVILVLLLPGIQLSYGGSLLQDTVTSRQFGHLLESAFTSRQLGLNGPGGVGLMTLFSVATDIYSKLDSDDVECQKKIICEFMKDNQMFGTGANTVRSGIRYATSFLTSWGIPYVDDIREAASLNDNSGKTCAELYSGCRHVSLKESYDNSVKKVFSITDQPKKNVPRKDEKEDEEEYEYYYDDRK